MGRLKDRVLYALTTSMPTPFEVAKDDVRLCGAIAAVDPATGRAESIERVEIKASGQDDDGKGENQNHKGPATAGRRKEHQE